MGNTVSIRTIQCGDYCVNWDCEMGIRSILEPSNGEMVSIETVGGVLRPFLSCPFWLVMVERDVKKGTKRDKKGQKVNLFGKVQADRPHL